MITRRTITLILVVASIVALIVYLNPESLPETETQSLHIDIMNKEQKAEMYDTAKEISSPDDFINVDSISVGELIGKKIILLDFWTYSCINCQRTLPYLNAWHEKYSDKGLVIIGVHTPEFKFEHKYENVLDAVERYDIKYPVVLDNDYSTWRAYKNNFWPRKYLIDIDGFIVYDHIGEGGYDETEKKIQKLLQERMVSLNMEGEVAKDIVSPEGAEEVDLSIRRSPEIYFGSSRNTYLGNGKSRTPGMQSLEAPTKVKTNVLYLDGEWNFTDEFAENKSAGARIIFRYKAQKVFFVASSEEGVNIRLLKDGEPYGEPILIKQDSLYRLIEDVKYGEHTLEIIIENPGLKAFTFTFG